MRKKRSYSPRRAIIPEKPGWRQELYEWLQLLTLVLAFVVIFFTFFGMIFGVSGSSMYPTLHDRDAMFIQRAGYTPAPGDIVVLRKDGFPYEDDTEAIVTHILYHLQEHMDYLPGLLAGESGEIFMGYFKKRLMAVFSRVGASSGHAAPRDYILNHMVCDFAETVRWWAANDRYTPEEISAFFFETTPLLE